MCRWHATVPPSAVGVGSGSTNLQMSIAYAHRGWYRHPGGGSSGLGGSPSSTSAHAGALDHRVGHGDRREQGLRVRVTRTAVHGLGVTDLDDGAEVHHCDAITGVVHDREVVRDEEERNAEPLLEIDEEVDHL